MNRLSRRLLQDRLYTDARFVAQVTPTHRVYRYGRRFISRPALTTASGRVYARSFSSFAACCRVIRRLS